MTNSAALSSKMHRLQEWICTRQTEIAHDSKKRNEAGPSAHFANSEHGRMLMKKHTKRFPVLVIVALLAIAIVIGKGKLATVLAAAQSSSQPGSDLQRYEDIPELDVVLVPMPGSEPGKPAPQTEGQAVLAGLVLPRKVPAGQTFSASMVPNSGADLSQLDGYVVDLGDGHKQPANKPLIASVPIGAAVMLASIFLKDRPNQPVAQLPVPVENPMTPVTSNPPSKTPTAPPPTHVPPGASDMPNNPYASVPYKPNPLVDGANQTLRTVPASAYDTPTVTSANAVQVVHGPNSGNVNDMSMKVDGIPAKIVAAKSGFAFYDAPVALASGPHQVEFVGGKGARPIVMTTYAVGISLSAGTRNLITHQSTELSGAIAGLDGLSHEAWMAATPSPDMVNLDELKRKVKGLRVPKPNDRGTVVVLLECTPNVRIGGRNSIVLYMHEGGPFTFQERLVSNHAGPFAVRASVTPFVKPTNGQFGSGRLLQ
jgi:hypothetical protein